MSGVTFSLKAGAGLALLGASASGKTSLSKALVGIWPAHRGAVRLDGAALDQWRNEDLGRHIGYLPQDVGLFDGTVAENICRFDESATSDAILKAAQIAGVHDIILRLPEGYATRIGAGGMSLSAGQKQRVGLARAVFGDPFLLVLDEPNANLDADGENALTRAIGIMRQNKSIVVVISHRPSALSALDMTMVLYEGKLIAFGPSAEVFARVKAANGKTGRTSAASAKQSRGLARRKCFVMKIIDPMYADDRSARLRINEPDDDGSGPQGAALILELQRLRQAFERENRPESNRPQPRRAPPDGQRPPGRRPRQARPKRSKKKGKMGRVLDAWLGPFGFQADAPDGDAPAPRGSQAVREPEFTSPQRARGPIIAPDDPSLINMPRPAPRPMSKPRSKPASKPAEMHAPRPVLDVAPSLDMRDPLRIEAPRLAPSISAGAVVSERPAGRMVDKARQGVTKGVAFLANRDGSPMPPARRARASCCGPAVPMSTSCAPGCGRCWSSAGSRSA